MPYVFLLIAVVLVALVAFGGDAALLAYLQNELVVRHGWMTMEEFTELTAIAQLTPGSPATNLSTYAAYAVSKPLFGFWAALGCSLLATLLLAAPSLWLMPQALRRVRAGKGHGVTRVVIGILRPLACGLTGAALVLMLTPGNFGSPSQSPWQFGVSLFLFAATAVGVGHFRFHPAFMLGLCAVAGFILL